VQDRHGNLPDPTAQYFYKLYQRFKRLQKILAAATTCSNP
jgi:hypothetical protein